MKILVCAQEYYPYGSGIANVAYYVVEELKKKGCDITVLSPTGPDIKKGNKKLIDKTGFFGIVHFWFKVAKFINKNKDDYDVIWLHNPLIPVTVNVSNIVATYHTTFQKYYSLYKRSHIAIHHKMYYLLIRLFEKLIHKKNQFLRITVVSSAVEKELIDLGKQGKIYYIKNGVDTKKFQRKDRVDFTPTKKYVLLYVGRSDYQKNLPGLIKTFKLLEEINHDVELIMVGFLDKHIEQLALDLNVNNIRFLGRVDHNKLPGIYQKCTVFVMSSVYEGQPLTIMEAISAGLPCILNNIDNFKQITQEVKEGLIVNYDNPKEAAKKINDYLLETNFKIMCNKLKKYAKNELDWSVITNKYFDLFNEVLHEK